MFVDALRIANRFTFPLVGLRRRVDGTVTSTIAAFVVLNREGWVVTSAHVADEILSARRQAEQVRSGRRPRGMSQAHRGANRHVDDGQGSAVAHHSELWAIPGFDELRPQVTQVHVDRTRDLALVHLDPFRPLPDQAYPVIRGGSTPIMPGLSVARLGYPFYDIEATYSPEADEFTLPPGVFPVPRFALDGIVSRFRQQFSDSGRSATFVETSTPGLRGQSGGPLVDREGRVVGIQSHTAHLDLGFDARYERDGAEVVERQFLNVGAATHATELVDMCRENDIEVRTD